MENTKIGSCGWFGTIDAFLNTKASSEWLQHLCDHHLACMNSSADESQVLAWKNSYVALTAVLQQVLCHRPSAGEWSIIFEYELPRERGRRPDVIILTRSVVLVLEFKDFGQVFETHVDQVRAYARDLRHYHAASHHNLVKPILVLTKATNLLNERDDATVVAPDQLSAVLVCSADMLGPAIEPRAWVQADYAPLPSLVSAARRIFEHEPLPQIRRAQSAGIPETIATLVDIAKQAQARGERHLALVTGVPGAGKTLVGLQFVYANHFQDADAERSAVFLSGNGPLVKVLQHALKSTIFVQDVHGFLKQYGGQNGRVPEEHIWVYDEAQRAWDAQRVNEKRGHATSEPEDFLRIGERMNSWAFMVGLIGEGQEIHLGEEAGLTQWNHAIANMSQPWIVHCPSKVSHLFAAAGRVETSGNLDLTNTLRSHLADDVQLWVRHLLEGDLAAAARAAQRVTRDGFDIYVTRSLQIAKDYVTQRYLGNQEKRYGLIASSKAKNLPEWDIQNGYNFTKNLREGQWYNDPPHSRLSCCQLRDVATEFACQGLELDFPIVGWGSDLLWRGAAWASPPQRRSSARDPHQLRINSYRVLLTRGRDGFIVFVPPESTMDSTYEALVTAGLRALIEANGAKRLDSENDGVADEVRSLGLRA
ncbi:DNA/RNA helicase domain-containing protein [Cupriavidus taiwanensis]|uniref:DNA/RNA helicase domain-containing protein n=1 Tax=Cupriavidus taiwanensis TaxID=164546 RepID=UPI000E10E47B|nr:DNA/RNA helicase domain-containing protein [Cupriavidus taiwanensis]SOY39577.1 conserved hypothetical protein [Cupriavidus taiwanensis]SOY42392.1 conserved hypothetical protein [Cupriavidus taiwanensis]SOY78987.1 conserved hypothetical protein [Cupriavidus taiwanensis]SOZ50290.1 conserved hypothetical protein [Cupriavidus taiwanensis]SOZ75652.1 conserved hypothetical protein [Cupriavidus taiwanensis]